MAAPVRFLQLPETAQKNVLENLETLELILLSFCSKKCKKIVKNVGSKAAQLFVDFQNELSLSAIFTTNLIQRLSFVDRETQENRQLEQPYHFNEPPFDQFRLGFDQWLQHYYNIFNAKEIARCLFSWTHDRYDIESIRRCLKNFSIRCVTISSRLSENNYRLMLTSGIFSKILILQQNAYQDAHALREILARNYDAIEIFGYFPDYFSKLDNILAINSSTIDISMSNFSDKSLNQFLKIWMKTSMPRLRNLRFLFAPGRVIDQNIVLNGVDYTVNRPNLRREIWREMEDGPYRDFVIEGLEITRVDRIKATINIEERLFKFYVWNE